MRNSKMCVRVRSPPFLSVSFHLIITQIDDTHKVGPGGLFRRESDFDRLWLEKVFQLESNLTSGQREQTRVLLLGFLLPFSFPLPSFRAAGQRGVCVVPGVLSCAVKLMQRRKAAQRRIADMISLQQHSRRRTHTGRLGFSACSFRRGDPLTLLAAGSSLDLCRWFGIRHT